MLQATWQQLTITTEQELDEMLMLYHASDIIAGAFDTETTGLHIVNDTPFLFQFGWLTSDLRGYTFAIDLERQPQLARKTISKWNELAEQLPIYLAHNVKYDLHMLTNIGLPYMAENLSDTMFYIRYAHDALAVKNGGPPLKLKEYAAKYIDGSAKMHERLLDKEKTEITKSLNGKLKRRLGRCTPPEKFKAKSYTLRVFDNLFKDPVFTASDLPEDAKEQYYDWLNNDVPLWLQPKVSGLVESSMIRYDKLNREVVTRYAHYDIVWVLEVWLQLDPVLTARENRIGVDIENQLIEPLLDMERVGFATDKEYLNNCEIAMAKYIKERRQHLYELAGEEIKTGQHERIKNLLQTRFNQEVESTNNDVLEHLCSELHREQPEESAQTIDFIETISELRTLEKWYSTYIIRFLKELQETDRLYTTIHQVGTVSGRVTSAFQQFPKHAIKTVNGKELFSPRKMIKITGGDYDSIVYLDYSQIELRFQALYTLLVDHPDLNLCRAYMPYNCSTLDAKAFDPQDPWCIKHAYTRDWFLNEAPEKQWTPTDVHGATTKAAFGIDETDPQYKDLRYIGKRVNFAKNYGAQFKKICTMFPDRTLEECRRIDAAYYIAFPGVKKYHAYCYGRSDYAYTTNLFGVRYYNVSGHKLINILVQGSAAFYLKLKIIELHKYAQENELKTRWQMQIHDELSWEHHVDDPPEVFFAFKEIMEDWEDGYVPIVADMEVTTSTWASQKEVETLEELQAYLSP